MKSYSKQKRRFHRQLFAYQHDTTRGPLKALKKLDYRLTLKLSVNITRFVSNKEKHVPSTDVSNSEQSIWKKSIRMKKEKKWWEAIKHNWLATLAVTKVMELHRIELH